MPAIGPHDDLHAWLLRGFTEAGLPDQTRGGDAPIEGAVSADELRLGGGVGGVLLQFAGFDPGEEWTYAVQPCLVEGKGSVHVRCEDTLFAHHYPDRPPERVAAAVLADVRAHTAAFRAWRQSGAEASMAERRSIPSVRGLACTPEFARWVQGHYAAGGSLTDGPPAGWWVQGFTKAAIGAAITVGEGREPEYRLGPAEATPLLQRPEYRAYVEDLRKVGLAMYGTGAVVTAVSAMILAVFGYNLFLHRAEVVLGQLGWPAAGVVTTGMLVTAHLLAGWRLRVARNRRLIQVCAVLGMIPCLGPCFPAGLPAGIWTLRILSDKRAEAVFGR
jgi:hypothetical protein